MTSVALLDGIATKVEQGPLVKVFFVISYVTIRKQRQKEEIEDSTQYAPLKKI